MSVESVVEAIRKREHETAKLNSSVTESLMEAFPYGCFVRTRLEEHPVVVKVIGWHGDRLAVLKVGSPFINPDEVDDQFVLGNVQVCLHSDGKLNIEKVEK